MTDIIICVIGIMIGVTTLGFGIYNRFFRSFVPNPKKWKRTRAKVVGRHHYQVKNLSKYGGPAYNECFEKSITYTVDGKSYKKYVADTENGAVHIYYNIKNPNIIRTANEVRRDKREWKSNTMFVSMMFLAVIFLSISIPLLVHELNTFLK